MRKEQAIDSTIREVLSTTNTARNISCSGITKSGDPCHAKAGPSGYCPMHNPARAIERERQRQAQVEAAHSAQAMHNSLRDVMKTISTICTDKGWGVKEDHFDYQTGRHASLTAYRYFNNSERVSLIIEITRRKDGLAHFSFEKTSFHSYGVESLIEAIRSDLKLFKSGEPHSESSTAPLATNSNNAVQRLEALLKRFHRVAHQLAQRPENKQPLILKDEYDVQYLLHALLYVLFDDIRPEDPVPQHAGKASRVDFLLKKEKIVIEVKIASKTLQDTKISEQLIIDITRYQAHPDCQTLVCFIYDPDHYLKNPDALENDLSGKHNNLTVKVIVSSPR